MDIGNIKQIQKRNKKGSVMLAHVEYAKLTFNDFALLTKNCYVFSLGHRYSNNYCFFPFSLTEISH